MKSTLKVIGAFFLAFFIGAFLRTAYSAPTSRPERTLLPETTATYSLGSSAKKWLDLWTTNATTTNLSVTGLANCDTIDTDASGNTKCGTDSSGSGSFPFSADTNYGQVVYSTSTPTLWFKSGLMASSTSYFVNAEILKLSNLTGNGFVKTSGGDGTLSVDTTTYESGLTAGDGITRTVNDFDCDTASGSVFGCLASADWTTFNNKQATLSATYPLVLTGATLSTPLATTTIAQTYGTAQTGAVTFATSSDTNLGFNITNTAGAFTFTPTWIGTLANARLTNSTISGKALGTSLDALTATNGTLTFSGSYDGSTARTVGLNLASQNAWTTTATTTFSGKLGVGTSTPADVQATFTVKGVMTSVAQFWTSTGTKILEILDSGVVTALGSWDFGGADSLEIPNGTAPTVDATGELAIDTTSDQLIGFGASAKKVYGNGNIYPAFTYSTSTAWTGTTTIPLGTAFVAETWNAVNCFTDVGTLNASFYDGTNRMNLFNASTTVGTVTLSPNNTFTASEKRYVDIGTPASSPTKISCTISKSLTAD
jgi:hypothetical protein